MKQKKTTFLRAVNETKKTTLLRAGMSNEEVAHYMTEIATTSQTGALVSEIADRSQWKQSTSLLLIIN